MKLLKEEDMEHGTHYIDALQVWLHLGCNYNAAAKKLGIHRNTMVSRIERIISLTGINPDDPKQQEALVLSLRPSGG